LQYSSSKKKKFNFWHVHTLRSVFVNSPPPKPEVILTNFFAEPTVLLVPITSRAVRTLNYESLVLLLWDIKYFFLNTVRWVKTGYWSLFGVFDLRKSIQLLNKNLLECWYLQKQVSRSHGRACIKKYGLSLSKSLCEILTFGYFSLKSIKTSVWVLSRTNVMWLEYNFGPNLTRLISFLLAAGRAFSGDIQKS
jgi:hypothetical protein